MSSTPRGLAPHEGLELRLMKTGRTGPLLEPRCRPQAGKSGDPHSQNADSGGEEIRLIVRDKELFVNREQVRASFCKNGEAWFLCVRSRSDGYW